MVCRSLSQQSKWQKANNSCLFYSFPFTSLPFSYKLHICLGGMKWVAHMWPNFSTDFHKLLSCCIPSWIPSEKCVKIGKSLIRWNGLLPNTYTHTHTHIFYFIIYLLGVCLQLFSAYCVTPVCALLWTVRGLPGRSDPKLNQWTPRARGANTTKTQLKRICRCHVPLVIPAWLNEHVHGLHSAQPNAGLSSGATKDGKSYLIKHTMQMVGNVSYK